MSNTPYQIYAAVYVIFERDGKMVFLRRANTGWRNGFYTLPAGHIEEGELPTATAVREMYEEVGVTIEEKNLTPIHVMYRISGDRTYVDFYYKVDTWDVEPYLAEPGKADDFQWFSPEELPTNTIEGVKFALTSIAKGEPISERHAD